MPKLLIILSPPKLYISDYVYVGLWGYSLDSMGVLRVGQPNTNGDMVNVNGIVIEAQLSLEGHSISWHDFSHPDNQLNDNNVDYFWYIIG